MLPPHALKIVLVEPEIPQNTGNIARLCAATGAALHLVRPLGYFLTDRHFRRSGMDYVKDVSITVHDDLPGLLAAMGDDPIVLTSGITGKSPWQFGFAATAWLLFGKESAGLPAALLDSHREFIVRIPMQADTRGLNVSTSAGIILYEALRQLSTNNPV